MSSCLWFSRPWSNEDEATAAKVSQHWDPGRGVSAGLPTCAHHYACMSVIVERRVGGKERERVCVCVCVRVRETTRKRDLPLLNLGTFHVRFGLIVFRNESAFGEVLDSTLGYPPTDNLLDFSLSCSMQAQAQDVAKPDRTPRDSSEWA